MTDPSGTKRRPSRAPLQARSRRRWMALAGVAAVWVLLMIIANSVRAGTILLVLLAVFVALVLVSLRMLGVTREHPWVQQLATRPWRDGRDVLTVGLRHLPEVFIVSPTGSLLAPNVVELRMNPGDYASLTDLMDLDLINASAAEAYLAAITTREARLASAGPVDLRVTQDPAVPAGRYQFRQGRLAGAGLAPGYSQPPAGFAGPPMIAPLPPAPSPSVPAAGYAAAAPAAYPVPAPAFAGGLAGPAGLAGPVGYAGYQPGEAFPFAHDGRTAQEPVKAAGGLPAPAGLPESATISAPTATPSPLLRLVTGGTSVETRVSGAQAGRGLSAELRLPDDPTVSRVHAKFTIASGNWSVTGLGLNGLMVNDVLQPGDCALHDGDVIRWGSRPDSLASRVEIR